VAAATVTFRDIAQRHGIAGTRCGARRNAREGTTFLIDPRQEPHLLAMSSVHQEFTEWLVTNEQRD
jgi:hypothetical protein